MLVRSALTSRHTLQTGHLYQAYFQRSFVSGLNFKVFELFIFGTLKPKYLNITYLIKAPDKEVYK